MNAAHNTPLIVALICGALLGVLIGYCFQRSNSSHSHTETHTHNGAPVSPDDPAVAEIHEAFDKADAAFAAMEKALAARAAMKRKKP